MCRFLSSIGLKNGDILYDPNIDSHEDLVAGYQLNDNGSQLRNWARLEYAPENDEDYSDIKKYKLKIDDSQFDWITNALKEKWERKLIQILKRLIIKSDTINLSGGTYILTKITVNKLFNCRILYAGDSTIKDAGYSTIEDAGRSTIKDAGYSTIKDAGYSTIKYAGDSTIEDAGYSTIEDAGCSTIKDAGYSTIEDAGCSTIKDAGYSTIEDAGYSTIEDAGRSTIKYAGRSTIEDAGDSTILN